MSSLSGAQFEADLPVQGPAGRTAAQLREEARKSESALLNKARDGDRSAYGQIVVLLQDRLYNALLRMVGDPDEARELTQETFTRGLTKIETFRGDSSAYTWLFRIGMNLAISNLRRVQRRRTFSIFGESRRGSVQSADETGNTPLDHVSHTGEESPPIAAERAERQQAVVMALGRLDPDYRAVLVMRDIEGFDYQQMADVLALPLGTLKSRLFRARLALRDELAPYLADKKVKR